MKDIDIKSLDIISLERNNFAEVFFSIGNVDAFFYIFEMITKTNKIDNEMCLQIASEVLNSISLLVAYKDKSVNEFFKH